MKKVYIAPNCCVAEFGMDDAVLLGITPGSNADEGLQLIKQIDLKDDYDTDAEEFYNDIW